MILVDANLLIYASSRDSVNHGKAKYWLEDVLNSDQRVAIPWHSFLAFIRITTNPRIFDNPLSSSQAVSQVEEWLNQDVVWVPKAGNRYFTILKELLMQSDATGNLVPDAHLAALSIENGLTLFSADRDFAKIKNLKWVNPLEE